MKKVMLKKGERLDPLNRNGYEIIQHPDRFCFGMDAVLLAGFAKMRPGEKAMDLGTGTGILPILMAARYPECTITGLEIQEESVDMARRSVAHNELEHSVTIHQGDIRQVALLYPGESFDVVVSNPPYMTPGKGLTNPNPALAVARHEILCDMDAVAKGAAALLPPRGRFYLVHRPRRLPELFGILQENKLEPKTMKLVYPSLEKEANLVLIEAVKGGGSQLIVEKPLIIYQEDGKYTQEIYDIYGY